MFISYFMFFIHNAAQAVTPIAISNEQDTNSNQNPNIEEDWNTETETPTETGWDITVEEKFSSAIINGNAGSIEDYPMTGGMLMRGVIFGQEFDTFVCSSTLIAPDVVLLAAHCLDDTAFTFGFGEVENKELFWTRQADLTTWDGSQQNPELPPDTIGVVDFVIHDGFSMENFDIGISQND